MVTVKFTSALKRFYPDLTDTRVKEGSVASIVQQLNNTYQGLDSFLLQEDGSLRKHVNIFIEEELINDRVSLSDEVASNQEVLIFQALSGG
jgi:sulfur-carrier protein